MGLVIILTGNEDCKRHPPGVNALAALKILSYFTVIIPLCMAISLGIAMLCGRVKTGAPPPPPSSSGANMTQVFDRVHRPNRSSSHVEVPAVLHPIMQELSRSRSERIAPPAPPSINEQNSIKGHDLDQLVNHILDNRGKLVFPGNNEEMTEDEVYRLFKQREKILLEIFRDLMGMTYDPSVQEILEWQKNPQVREDDSGSEWSFNEENDTAAVSGEEEVSEASPAQNEEEKVYLNDDDETVFGTPRKEIPEDCLFISETKYFFDIRELEENCQKILSSNSKLEASQRKRALLFNLHLEEGTPFSKKDLQTLAAMPRLATLTNLQTQVKQQLDS